MSGARGAGPSPDAADWWHGAASPAAGVTPRSRACPWHHTQVPGPVSRLGCAMSSTISLVFVVIGLLATLFALAIVLRRSSGRERAARIAEQGQASLKDTAETQRR